MIGAPPSPVGADHSRATAESPAAAATRVGSVGTFTGVVVAGALGVLSPTALIATTRTETGTPFETPVMTADVVVPDTVIAVDHVAPPFDCSIRYCAMVRPPVDDGAVHDTDT
jgi:hypothetical protein